MKKRIVSLLCAVAMLTVLLVVPPAEPAYAAPTKAELEAQKAEAKANAEAYKKQIEALQDDKNRAIEQKLLLDQRNEELKKQISTVKMQIENTEAAIVQYEAEEKAQYELFCRQMRQEEERGAISYWSVLFRATGFADLLSRIDFINEVMEYDQRVIRDLRQLREQLKTSREELQAQKTELDDTQVELEAQIAEADRVINEFASTEEGLLALQREEERLFEQTEQMLKDYYAQNGGTSSGVEDKSTQGVLNGLIWPSNARYITDKFGERDQPTAGATTNHKGVDIGAPYYSDVFASQSGTVIQAGWNGSYGYCVTIAHDAGVATLYAHLNDYFVRVGQSVSRGQVIAECGSTGISTGPHIHFEVRVNGVQIDPLPYLPGYIAWW